MSVVICASDSDRLAVNLAAAYALHSVATNAENGGAKDCATLAGKNSLNRLEHAPSVPS